jgi:hypothetical protein
MLDYGIMSRSTEYEGESPQYPFCERGAHHRSFGPTASHSNEISISLKDLMKEVDIAEYAVCMEQS